MRKSTMRMYNIIAFIILPIVIILSGLVYYVRCRESIMAPTVDYAKVTSTTQTGELWEVLTIVEGEYAYVIYCIDDPYSFGAEMGELIAFQGDSIKQIRDTICENNPGAYATSYWEGKGQKFNYTSTYDFKQYLEDIKNTSYEVAPDLDVITADFSNVTLYDLSEYKGYEQDYNNGAGIVLAFVFVLTAVITLVALGIELLVAVILMNTIFKSERGYQHR